MLRGQRGRRACIGGPHFSRIKTVVQHSPVYPDGTHARRVGREAELVGDVSRVLKHRDDVTGGGIPDLRMP